MGLDFELLVEVYNELFDKVVMSNEVLFVEEISEFGFNGFLLKLILINFFDRFFDKGLFS